MVRRLDHELDRVDERVGRTLKLLDRDEDGFISRGELVGALGFLRETLGPQELEGFLGRLGGASGARFSVERLRELRDEAEGGPAGAGSGGGGGGGWVPPLKR